jgi:serralysin
MGFRTPVIFEALLARSDMILGNKFADSIHAGNGNDVVQTGYGNDRLFGDKGNDDLNGGPGNDFMTGGIGRDTSIGGANLDKFIFNAVQESVVGANRDVIADLIRGQHDRIDLHTIDASTTAT